MGESIEEQEMPITEEEAIVKVPGGERYEALLINMTGVEIESR